MLLLVGTIRLPPGGLGAARETMRAMIAASRAEPGCIEYAYSEDVLEPGLIHVKEAWESRTALQAHFQSAHLQAWRAAWATLGVTDRRLRLHEAGESEPV